jgi:hypothetical protein
MRWSRERTGTGRPSRSTTTAIADPVYGSDDIDPPGDNTDLINGAGEGEIVFVNSGQGCPEASKGPKHAFGITGGWIDPNIQVPGSSRKAMGGHGVCTDDHEASLLF